MTAGLKSPSGSKMQAVMANTFLFVLLVASVVGTWVVLLRTCSWSVDGIQSNPVWLLHCHWLVTMFDLFLSNLLECCPWMKGDWMPIFSMWILQCRTVMLTLVANGLLLPEWECHLEDHLRRNHCSVLELIVDDYICYHLHVFKAACCQIRSWICTICYSVEFVLMCRFFSGLSPLSTL